MMEAARTRTGNIEIQASWGNRGWAQSSMAYLALLSDPKVMENLQLSSSFLHASRSAQNDCAKEFYRMVRTAINVRETSMSIHSETAPDHWNGILDQDPILGEECHTRIRAHAETIAHAKQIILDPESPKPKVMT